MRRTLALLAAAVVALVGLSACSDDSATVVDLTPTTTPAPTASSVTTTTLDDGAAPAVPDHACAVLSNAMADTGISLLNPAEGAITGEAESCGWSGGVTLTISNDVDSSTFEAALSDASFGDPSVVDGVGEMAAFGDGKLIAFANRRLVFLSSAVPEVGRAELESLARAVLDRLG